MPAARAFIVVGLATLAVAVAVAVPWLAACAVVLDALLVAALVIDARRAASVPLSARRLWPPLLVQGARAAVEVRVSSPARVILLAREALHPGLAAGPLRHRLTVAPGDEASWRYEILPRWRGEHTVGPLTVRVLGPWGLAWSQRDLLSPDERRVYPQTRWEGRVGRLLALADRRELGQAPLRIQSAGTEPYALREYRPGDPPTRIQWKASARHQRLLSREDTWERGTRLVILLDCARAMTSLDGARSKLDHALAAALALTRIAVSRGDRVTVIGFSDRIERVIRVRSGSRGVALAYGALYDLAARLTEPAYDLAVETVSKLESRRALVVLLTSVVDLVASELLRSALVHLSRKHRPALINLEDPDLTRLAFGVPAIPEEAFAKTSALEMLLGNRRLGRRLQRAGIAVGMAAADQLAWRTLETYFGLSRWGSRPPPLAQRRSVHLVGQAPSTTGGSEPSAR
ncbi:MAG TPA: DUF58 domain-containing protein [Vicinamibacteria bacterium]|jgi:uncharacterized protein (DUF58 family)|nr:DUF58 domain-containing protein [Vicinamibacteria bacterium]